MFLESQCEPASAAGPALVKRSAAGDGIAWALKCRVFLFLVLFIHFQQTFIKQLCVAMWWILG